MKKSPNYKTNRRAANLMADSELRGFNANIKAWSEAFRGSEVVKSVFAEDGLTLEMFTFEYIKMNLSGSFRSPPLSCPGGKADPIRGKLTGSDSLTRPKRKRTRFYHNQARANYTPGGGLHVFHLVENDMSRDE